MCSMSLSAASPMTYKIQMQRTVTNKVPLSYVRRAAADLGRLLGGPLG